MEIETISQILIYSHAGLGGIALVAGLIALSVTKGGAVHKKAGKVFFYTMLSSALLAILVACLPGHQNPFLFAIGVFSSYFLVGGFRSVQFKRKDLGLGFDKTISWAMVIVGIGMIIYPVLVSGRISIVLLVFGIIGFIFAIRDLRYYNNLDKLRQHWLRLHLIKMVAGYIAAVTAFVVVNQVFPGFYGWFVPSVVGTGYIVYWANKLERKAFN